LSHEQAISLYGREGGIGRVGGGPSMSTLETARRRLESALAELETGLADIKGGGEALAADAGDSTVAESRILEEIASLRAEQDQLAADLAKSQSERETQKEINRSVVEILDTAIGRLDTILAE
jgi:chromosome segregation ATPase